MSIQKPNVRFEYVWKKHGKKTERLTSDRPTKQKKNNTHTHSHKTLSFERRTNESHTKNWKQTATTNHLHITHSPILILIHNHISYYTHYMDFYIKTEQKICLLCHKNISVVVVLFFFCRCCQCVYYFCFLLATGIVQRSFFFVFAETLEEEWRARGRRNSCRGCWCCYCCCCCWFSEWQRQKQQWQSSQPSIIIHVCCAYDQRTIVICFNVFTVAEFYRFRR